LITDTPPGAGLCRRHADKQPAHVEVSCHDERSCRFGIDLNGGTDPDRQEATLNVNGGHYMTKGHIIFPFDLYQLWSECQEIFIWMAGDTDEKYPLTRKNSAPIL
jgi:hypothetical protein